MTKTSRSGAAPWWRSHGVRLRLTLWYVAAMMVALGVYVFGVYTFVSRNVSEALDERLRADFYWAAGTVDEGPDGLIMPFPQIDLLLEEESPWVQVWSADGAQLLLSNDEAKRRPIPESQSLAAQGEDMIVSLPTTGVPVRVLSRRSYIVDRPVTIQVARSEATMRGELRELSLIFMFGLPVAVVIAGVGGYTLARRALAPIEQMTNRARTITAERLSDRLPVANPEDEMGRLASVFNETLSRLEGSFDQMRHFTTDVSHELRTPLTAIRSVGEVGLRGHRNEASYRGIIGSMLEEVDRLSQLVDRLLTLSRAGTQLASFSLDAVDLGRPGRGRGLSPGSTGRRERSDTDDREDRCTAGSCRSSVAAAGAHQSRRQRDQVHAGSGTGPASSDRDPVAGRRRRDRHRARCSGTRRGTTSSIVSIAAMATTPSGRDSGCPWPGVVWKR